MLIVDQFAKHFETLLLSENAPFQHSFKMKKKIAVPTHLFHFQAQTRRLLEGLPGGCL